MREITEQQKDKMETNIASENEGITGDKKTNAATENDSSSNKGIFKGENTIRYYSPVDLAVISFCSLILVADQFVQNPALRWVAAGLGIASMFFPAVFKRIKTRISDEFTLARALKVLTDAGLKPQVINGEIHWISSGKENIVRVFDGGLLQLAREYPIGRKGAIDNNEKAAVSTMREICSVKVGVRREGEDEGSLIFSAESLCPTGKLFKQVFSGYVQALDVAEERQGVHLQEVLEEKRARRIRIGFDYNDYKKSEE